MTLYNEVITNQSDTKYKHLKPNAIHMFKKLILPFVGILAIGLVIFVLVKTQPNSDTPLFGANNQIIAMEPGAFGSLSSIASDSGLKPDIRATSPTAPSGDITSEAPAPAGSFTSDPSPDSTISNSESTGTVTVTPVDQKMAGMIVAPDDVPTVYKYIYKGEPVALSEATVEVLKRLPQKTNAESLMNLIKNFNFGLVDLAGLQNTEVQNITFKQDQDKGYIMDLNFTDSSFNLYQNWEKWDYPGAQCGEDTKCYEDTRLKMSDIPSDEALVGMADAFLQEYKINRADYGEPIIQKYWERDMMIAKQEGRPEGEIYVPDTINLVYPMLLSGKPVSDQWGNPMGLNVGVNIFNKKVSSINGLRVNQFQSSAYEAITDWATIADYLANGASYPPYYFDGVQAKVKEIEVGAPEPILINLWQYKENESVEYFTPALKFPIIQPEGEFFYQESVIVPLAKELLAQNDAGRPMPYMKVMEDVTPVSTPLPPVEPSPSSTPALPRG